MIPMDGIDHDRIKYSGIVFRPPGGNFMSTPLSLTFDAIECIDQLKAVGVPEDQAKRHVKMLSMVVMQVEARMEDIAAKRDKQSEERFDSLADRSEQQVKGRLDGLATRQELDIRLTTVEANLRRDIKELDARIETTKAELKRDIKELELRMVIKTGAMILGGIGLLFGLMRAWPLPVQYVPTTQGMHMPMPSGQGVPAPSR
ncbi:MAG: hypothetical protein HQL96_00850 [Magnetococcales bacterium]|nr:hypothetical protein [Magnetococcales bacterium]